MEKGDSVDKRTQQITPRLFELLIPIVKKRKADKRNVRREQVRDQMGLKDSPC